MLLDLSDNLGPELHADVCVIGAGAAGITIATELCEGPLSVVVLESGGLGLEERTQRLYEGEHSGLAHGSTEQMRFRVFGGTTTRWAGQALPLLEIDFSPRSWVRDSGWPLERRDLDPYYHRACGVLGIPPFTGAGANAASSPLGYAPRFDQSLAKPVVSRFTGEPNFATRYGRQLAEARNVRVVLHANVTEIVTDRSGSSVEYVDARDLSGRRLRVDAGTFILCVGGIETPRLLLASTRYQAAGIGNSHDLVGRYFQDHPGIAVGSVLGGDERRARTTFRPRVVDGIRYQPLIRASEELQAREGLLNVFASVLYPPNRSIEAAKVVYAALRSRRLSRDARSALRTVAGDPLPTVAAGVRHLRHQPAMDTSATPYLTVGGEQAPNRDSRVYLSSACDELGIPKVVVDWRLTEHELRSWRRFAEVTAEEIERCGFGRVRLEEFHPPSDPRLLSGLVIDAGHHMGTTRMASSPTSGVVDPELRLFGVTNLFIASSSVFPTGGFSNPTLTIIALAVRLSDRLLERGR